LLLANIANNWISRYSAIPSIDLIKNNKKMAQRIHQIDSHFDID